MEIHHNQLIVSVFVLIRNNIFNCPISCRKFRYLNTVCLGVCDKVKRLGCLTFALAVGHCALLLLNCMIR